MTSASLVEESSNDYGILTEKYFELGILVRLIWVTAKISEYVTYSVLSLSLGVT